MHTMSGKQFGKIRQFLHFNDTPTQPQSGTPGRSILPRIRVVFRPSQKTKYESANKMKENKCVPPRISTIYDNTSETNHRSDVIICCYYVTIGDLCTNL